MAKLPSTLRGLYDTPEDLFSLRMEYPVVAELSDVALLKELLKIGARVTERMIMPHYVELCRFARKFPVLSIEGVRVIFEHDKEVSRQDGRRYSPYFSRKDIHLIIDKWPDELMAEYAHLRSFPILAVIKTKINHHNRLSDLDHILIDAYMSDAHAPARKQFEFICQQNTQKKFLNTWIKNLFTALKRKNHVFAYQEN